MASRIFCCVAIAFAALGNAVAEECPADTVINLTVRTSSGTVDGHVATNKSDVYEYLGIPYAQPPIGDLRFAPPAVYNSTARFEASSYSPDCPQVGLSAPPIKYPNETPQFNPIISAFGGGRGNPQSEDCLTLNVWTKRPGSANKTAVLLWIHGGRFVLGDTNTPFYQGQYLVDSEDIVFVSINYRLNIFGFPGAPGVEQNAGLLDQRRAIEWVRDNIAGFGGDPDRISIMGQSAGGSAVDYYAFAYPEDPIVAGLISHSGTAHSFVPNTEDYARTSFLAAAASINCTGSDDAAVVACMRKANFKDVLGAVAKVKPATTPALIQPVFQPIVDNKTVFSLSSYESMSLTGQFAKIPYLAGNTDKEDGFYHIAAAGSNITLTDQQWTDFDLQGFTCATLDAVTARVSAKVSTWRYRYFGTWANLELYPGSGAYHGSDLHMVFGGIEDITGIPNSAAENSTMQYQMKAWASFVKDPVQGLTSVMGWPEYSASATIGENLVMLAFAGNITAVYGPPEAYDYACTSSGTVLKAQGAF